MAFSRSEVEVLLAKAHRRCCICHRFCGTKIETDHMLPRAEGGSDDISNAIPVCFDCHAEIHAYNDLHPRGRKFTPNELKQHKEQWLVLCETNPSALIPNGQVAAEVGPVQSMIDELEFNLAVARRKLPVPAKGNGRGAPFSDRQFRRGLDVGAFSLLNEDLKFTMFEAYVAITRANGLLAAEINELVASPGRGAARTLTTDAFEEAAPLIEAARRKMLDFLRSEP